MPGNATEQHIAASTRGVKLEAAWASVQGDFKLDGRGEI